MQIKDYFERIYVINLPHRVDRRNAITQEMATADLPLIPGKIEIFSAIRPADAAGFPSIGVRGCFLSHLSILKHAQAAGLANVLVMEDDLAISEALVTQQHSLIEQLQQTNWDFIYFGHNEQASGGAPANGFQSFSERVMLAHFYAVNSRILDRLITFLDTLQERSPGHPEGGPMHLDGAYSTFRKQNPDVVTLLAFPSLGWQRSSRSDITPKWVDQIPLLDRPVDAIRAFKKWLRSDSTKRKKLSSTV